MVKAKYNLMENAQTSGLSLGERILAASYEAKLKLGKELKEPAYYKDKLYNLKKDLETQMKTEGKSAEDVINSYIDKVTTEYRKKLKEGEISKHYDSFLIDILEDDENRKVDCVGATALYITLAEMLDKKLYKDIEIVNFENWGGDEPSHVLLRKKSSRGYINFGEKISEGEYKEKIKGEYLYYQIAAKDKIVAYVYANAGDILSELGEDTASLKMAKKALNIFSESLYLLNNIGYYSLSLKKYEDALKFFNRALQLDQEYIPAWINKQYVYTQLKNKEKENTCKRIANYYTDKYFGREQENFNKKREKLENISKAMEKLEEGSGSIHIRDIDKNYIRQELKGINEKQKKLKEKQEEDYLEIKKDIIEELRKDNPSSLIQREFIPI